MNDGSVDLTRRKAEFCLTTGIAPSEYDVLTLDEVNIFIEVYTELNQEG